MLYYTPLFCVILCVMLYQYVSHFIVFITRTLYCLYSVTTTCIIPTSVVLHDVIPYYYIFQLINHIILFCTNLNSNYLITITMTTIILIMMVNIIFFLFLEIE